jgi:hypothetical protein
MLDRALRETFGNFSTFFLICLTVTLPLSLGHSYAFRNVIEVHELHDQIEDFPADRAVRDVGPDTLSDYRTTVAVLALVELALLLLLVRPTRRVLDVAAAGRVPTAIGAWRGGFGSPGGYLRAFVRSPVPVLAALILAALLGLLAERVGLLLAQPLGDQRAWLGLGLAQAVARAGAAPFFLVPWAMATAREDSITL